MTGQQGFSISSTISIGDIATSMSILVALAVAVAGYWQGFVLARRTHTLELALSRFTGDEDAAFQKYLNELITREDCPSGDVRDPEIAKILTVYEYMALAARKRALDWRLIFELRGPLLTRVFLYLEPYIRRQRELAKNPMLYEHYEWLIRKRIEKRLIKRGVDTVLKRH